MGNSGSTAGAWALSLITMLSSSSNQCVRACREAVDADEHLQEEQRPQHVLTVPTTTTTMEGYF